MEERDACGRSYTRRRRRSSGSSTGGAEQLERAGYSRRRTRPSWPRGTTSTCTARSSLLRHGCPPSSRSRSCSSASAGAGRVPGRIRCPMTLLASIPSPHTGDDPRRPAVAPHVRADAPARDRRLHRAHRLSAGRGAAATGISSSASPSGASPSAIIGARLYHDITSWNEVPDPKWKGVFEVWKGGLGVWGGILFGVPRRRDRRPPLGATERRDCSWTRSRRACCSRRGSAAGATGATRSCSASRPTLPWGLKIDPQHRPRQYPDAHALPSDLPLRVRLGPRRRRSSCSCSTGASAFKPPGCSRSTSPVHVRPLLRGAAPHRPVAPPPRRCA